MAAVMMLYRILAWASRLLRSSMMMIMDIMLWRVPLLMKATMAVLIMAAAIMIMNEFPRWVGQMSRRLLKLCLAKCARPYIDGEVDVDELDFHILCCAAHFRNISLNVDAINAKLCQSAFALKKGSIKGFTVELWPRFEIILDGLELRFVPQTARNNDQSSAPCKPSYEAHKLQSATEVLSAVKRPWVTADMFQLPVWSGFVLISDLLKQFVFGAPFVFNQLSIAIEESSMDNSSAREAHQPSMLLFRISHAVSIVTGSEAIGGDRRGGTPFHVKNKVSFQQLSCEMVNFCRDYCGDMSSREGGSQWQFRRPISFMENDAGVSGHFKVSINAKQGCSEVPEVDATVNLESIRLHCKDLQIRQLINLTISFLDRSRIEDSVSFSCGHGVGMSPGSPTLSTASLTSTSQLASVRSSQDSQVTAPVFCSLCFFEAFSCLPLLSGLSIIMASFSRVPLAISARIAEVSVILNEDGFEANTMEAAIGGVDLFWQVNLNWLLRLKHIELYHRQYQEQGDCLVHDRDDGRDCNVNSKPTTVSADPLQTLADLSVPEFPVLLSNDYQATKAAPHAVRRKCMLRILGQGHLAGLQVEARHKLSSTDSSCLQSNEREELGEYEVHLQPLALWEDALLIRTVQHWIGSFGCVAEHGKDSDVAGPASLNSVISPTPSSMIAREVKIKMCFSLTRIWICSPRSSLATAAIWNGHLLCLDLPFTNVELTLPRRSTLGESDRVCAGSARVALAETCNIYVLTPIIQTSVVGQKSALRCNLHKALSILLCNNEPVTVEVFYRQKCDQILSLAELAWTAFAKQQEKWAGSEDTEADQRLMDETNYKLRADISLLSSTSIIVSVPKAKVEILPSHVHIVVGNLMPLANAAAAACQRMKGGCLTDQKEVCQTSVSLDVRNIELRLHNIEGFSSFKMTACRSYVISLTKFQMLHAVGLGMNSNASYLWVHHRVGHVKGLLADEGHDSTEVELLTFTDDARDWACAGGRRNSNSLATKAAGLEVSMMSWPGRSKKGDTSIHGVLKDCLFMAHGGHLDWFPRLIACLSQHFETITDAITEHSFLPQAETGIHVRLADGKERAEVEATSLSNNCVLFSLELCNAALCYEAASTALSSSKDSAVQFDPVSCSLVAASVWVSNNTTVTAASNEYKIAFRDVVLLLADRGSTLKMRGNHSSFRKNPGHMIGYVKVAGVSNAGAVVDTSEPKWNIASTGGQLQLDTCVDNAEAQGRLVAHLQQLFGPQKEHNYGIHGSEDCGLDVHNGYEIGTWTFQDWQVQWRLYQASHGPMSIIDNPEAAYARQSDPCMELVFHSVSLQRDIYPSSASTASRLLLLIEEVAIYDSTKNAPWKKVLGGHLSTSAQFWKLELESVRPNPSITAEEYWLTLQPPPLRLRFGNWHYDFLSNIFNGIMAAEEADDAPPSVFQTVEVHACRVQVDYAPCQLEETAALLAPGDHTKLVNQIALKYVDLELKHVSETQIHGWERLFRVVVDRWWEDITRNQTSNLLKGVGPVRSLLALGSAAAELVRLPTASEYQRDRDSLYRGVARGMRGIFHEAVIGGVQVAAGAEEILSRAGSAMGSSGLGAEEQPWSAEEGRQKALERLCGGWERAESGLIREPQEAFRRSGRKRDAFKSFLRAAPGVAIASLEDGVGAAHLLLRGVRNGREPWRRLEFEDRHSLPPPDDDHGYFMSSNPWTQD